MTENSKAMGVFKPAIPKDQQAVLRLFAIAAKVVCQNPESFHEVNNQLEALKQKLIPPESTAAHACDKLWKVFAKVTVLPKMHVVVEAGKAFYRDLDTISQKLDLPPMEEWEQLPEEINEPDSIDWHEENIQEKGQTLKSVRQQAFEAAKPLKKNEFIPAVTIAQWILALDMNEQRSLFNELVGKGIMGRAEVNLLARCLIKGDTINQEDTALVETLHRLGRWLSEI